MEIKNVPTWCVCRRTVGGCWSSLPPCCWSSPWSPWTFCTRRCTPSSGRSRSLLFFDQTNSFLLFCWRKLIRTYYLMSLILAPHINVCHLEANQVLAFDLDLTYYSFVEENLLGLVNTILKYETYWISLDSWNVLNSLKIRSRIRLSFFSEEIYNVYGLDQPFLNP